MTENMENVLAQTNLDGYSEMLLYDALANSSNEIKNMDKESLSELLESEQIQAAVRQSALEYSAKLVNKNGMARGLLLDNSYCENSWVYWLPMFNCPEPEPIETQNLALIKDGSYKCYQPDQVVI